MIVLRVATVLSIGVFCLIKTEDDKSISINQTLIQKRIVRAATNEIFKNSGSSNKFYETSVFGFSAFAACALILGVAFYGGCLVCPKWKLSFFNRSKSSPCYVERIDSGDVCTNFPGNIDSFIVCNPSIDHGKTFDKTRTDRIVAHSNPCFNMDEVTKESLKESRVLSSQINVPDFEKTGGNPVYFNVKKKCQRTSMEVQLPDSLILANRYLHDGSRAVFKPGGPVMEMDKENTRLGNVTSNQIHISSVSFTTKHSGTLNLLNFYNTTEYLNKTHSLGVRGLKPSVVLCDVTNSRRVSKRSIETGGQLQFHQLVCNLPVMSDFNIEPYPNNLTDTFYDMNDMAFKNLGAK